MSRTFNPKYLVKKNAFSRFGLTVEMLGNSITYVHDTLDGIDSQLLGAGGLRLAELLELANLSAIIGNLYRGGVVKTSKGGFSANTPHTYPDLLGKKEGCKDIEIKVALETNKPKGHLVKPGPHITVRYVLASEDGIYERGKHNRGNIPWIWEIRVGTLKNEHFNISNTEGDSGKTAVINAVGMKALQIVYCDLEKCPLSKNGAAFLEIASMFG